MKFTFPLPHIMRLPAMTQPWESTVTGPDQLRIAARAEALGYDMIAIPEHMAIPPEEIGLSGKFWFHSTVAQAALAGATSRIRLNSCITILPFQHPIVMAKALATADWMSGGRMMVTFGIGSMQREYEILGVPFRERGRIADEFLAAIIALWTQDSPSFEGRYVSFRDIGFEPKPVQKPHLPIWMGGDSDAALRRAARFASGWIVSFRTKPEDIPARIDFIKAQPEWKERDFEVMFGLGTTRITDRHAAADNPDARPGMSAAEIVDRLGAYKALGVTTSSVPIPPLSGIEAYLDYAQWVMEEIRPKLQ
jgi:probable F420-dependent oxidoreductase